MSDGNDNLKESFIHCVQQSLRMNGLEKLKFYEHG